jgi:hypothetical protein
MSRLDDNSSVNTDEHVLISSFHFNLEHKFLEKNISKLKDNFELPESSKKVKLSP